MKFANPEEVSMGDAYDKLSLKVDPDQIKKAFIFLENGKIVKFDFKDIDS